MGIFGILFEGGGLIFLSFNPIMWAYAFVIHASYLAMAHIIINKDPYLIINDRKSISNFKKYLFSVLASLLITIPYFIWMSIIKSIS